MGFTIFRSVEHFPYKGGDLSLCDRAARRLFDANQQIFHTFALKEPACFTTNDGGLNYSDRPPVPTHKRERITPKEKERRALLRGNVNGFYERSEYVWSVSATSCMMYMLDGDAVLSVIDDECLEKVAGDGFCSLFVHACGGGQTELVRKMLKYPKKVETLLNGARRNDSLVSLGLVNACRYGRVDIVHLLIKHKRELEFVLGLPMRIACFYGHVDIVKTLLDTNHINESMDVQTCLERAAEQGHEHIVKLLWPKIESTVTFGLLLELMCRRNRGAIVKMILSEGKVAPHFNNAMFYFIFEAPQSPMIKLFVEYYESHPKAFLELCGTYARDDIMDLLVAHDIDVTCGGSEALVEAATYDRVSIVAMLLKDGRLRNGEKWREELKEAMERAPTKKIAQMIRKALKK